MILAAFLPCAQLAPYIESIWVQEDLQPVNYGTQNPIKVLPSTSVVMGFQYGERQKVTRNGTSSLLSHYGISGLQTGPVLYRNTGAVGSVIVRFTPWGAGHFFRCPATDFKDRNIDGTLVYNSQKATDAVSRLAESSSARARVVVVESYLLSLLQDKPIDKLIRHVTLAIQQSQGLLRIEEIAGKSGISKRQLERRFNEVVGISPKKFSSIVRFQSSLHLFSRNDTLTALAYDAGYFDQAHFIKEFQAFAGETPDRFFSKRLQPELSQVFNAKNKLSLFYHSLYQ